MLNKELLEQQLAELPLYVYEFIDPTKLEFSDRIRWTACDSRNNWKLQHINLGKGLRLHAHSVKLFFIAMVLLVFGIFMAVATKREGFQKYDLDGTINVGYAYDDGFTYGGGNGYPAPRK